MLFQNKDIFPFYPFAGKHWHICISFLPKWTECHQLLPSFSFFLIFFNKCPFYEKFCMITIIYCHEQPSTWKILLDKAFPCMFRTTASQNSLGWKKSLRYQAKFLSKHCQPHRETISVSATSPHILNPSRDGDYTTALGSLFQCLTQWINLSLYFIVVFPYFNIIFYPDLGKCSYWINTILKLASWKAISQYINLFWIGAFLWLIFFSGLWKGKKHFPGLLLTLFCFALSLLI